MCIGAISVLYQPGLDAKRPERFYRENTGSMGCIFIRGAAPRYGPHESLENNFLWAIIKGAPGLKEI